MLHAHLTSCPYEIDGNSESKNYTSVILSTNSILENSSVKDPHIINNFVKLIQEPSENLIVTLSNFLDNHSNYSYNRYSFSNRVSEDCHLLIQFENVVHEFLSKQEYKYEIKLFILSENANHVNIFSRIEIPKNKQISIDFEAANISKAFSQYIVCLHIYRYKNKTNYFKTNLGTMLFETGYYSDFCLTAGEKKFKVHKHILSLKSEIFKKMFIFIESQTGFVEIEDFESEVVEEMLFFIYTQKTKNISKFPSELYMIAHKYQIDELIVECYEYLIFNLSTETIVKTLKLAKLYDLKDLMEILHKFINKHEEVLSEDQCFQEYLILDLSVDTIPFILKLCVKYKDHLESVKQEAFKFIKMHSKEVKCNQEFLNMFTSHPLLLQELFIYEHK